MNKIKILTTIRNITLVLIIILLTLWFKMVTDRINELKDKTDKIQVEINELRGN